MRRPFGVFTVACLGVSLTAAVPASATVTDLWVKNGTTSCTDTGTGSQLQPFCTLAAATTVVTAGQTVHVAGFYDERLTITRSGTPEQPITFMVDPGYTAQLVGPNAGISIQGQHDIALVGFWLSAEGTSAPVTVGQSTRIRLDRINQTLLAAHPAGIQLTGVTDSAIIGSSMGGPASAGVSLDVNTTGVTVRGGNIQVNGTDSRSIEVFGPDNVLLGNLLKNSRGAGIRINPGAHRTVIANNRILAGQGHGVHNTDANDTAISSNLVHGRCGTGIRIDGTSTGVSLQNTVTTDNGQCVASVGEVNIGVYDGAVGHTTVDYNVVHGSVPGHLYAWQTPMDLAQFRAASGQGEHDLNSAFVDAPWDSANSAAPGWQTTDSAGRKRVDHPSVTNKGAGLYSYGDRGDSEQVAPPAVRAEATSQRTRAGRLVTVDASASTVWKPLTMTYTFDFGDGTVVTQDSPFGYHVYRDEAPYILRVGVTDSNGLRNTVSISNPTEVGPPRRTSGGSTLPIRYRNVW